MLVLMPSIDRKSNLFCDEKNDFKKNRKYLWRGLYEMDQEIQPSREKWYRR
jgi:hypothetical protein